MFIVPDVTNFIIGFMDLGSLAAFMGTCKHAHCLLYSPKLVSEIRERDRFSKWLQSGESEFKLSDNTYMYTASIGFKRLIMSSRSPLAARIHPGALQPVTPMVGVDGNLTHVRVHGTVWSYDRHTVNRFAGNDLIKRDGSITIVVSGEIYTVRSVGSAKARQFEVTCDDTTWKLTDSVTPGSTMYYHLIDQQLIRAPVRPVVVAYIATGLHPIFQWLA